VLHVSAYWLGALGPSAMDVDLDIILLIRVINKKFGEVHLSRHVHTSSERKKNGGSQSKAHGKNQLASKLWCLLVV
jgi:hypothetical protein